MEWLGLIAKIYTAFLLTGITVIAYRTYRKYKRKLEQAEKAIDKIIEAAKKIK